MKVKDLIKYLQKQDSDSEVGFFDHFGEFNALRDSQIYQRTIRRPGKKNVVVVIIEPPDFGPEPD